ncbi:ArsR/SmtB family transcription factor [Camelliibacillus cellulosilyticus]|uniref:ArsR/SmtB family transcription factor n=1 Tax=Camelliibacillus cellulosilyticus TaxID=2174486 RepID=A0ABV9GRW5_9BACL
MVEWKTQTLELMKALSNPRRNKILHFAEEPITVKELAEKMDEKPSRLYYHVNKLVEAELLEVVDTKQQGNLVEKYYKTNTDDLYFKGDVQLLAEHMPEALAAFHQVLDPGIKLYEKNLQAIQEMQASGDLDNNKYPYQVSVSRWSTRSTAKEWHAFFGKLLKAMGKLEEGEPLPELPRTLSIEEENEKGSYEYILLSYRIEDAEKLGLIGWDGEDE